MGGNNNNNNNEIKLFGSAERTWKHFESIPVENVAITIASTATIKLCHTRYDCFNLRNSWTRMKLFHKNSNWKKKIIFYI